MRYIYHRFFIIIFLSLTYSSILIGQAWLIEEIGNLDEKVSNNAVCQASTGNIQYVYSFGGIDESKTYTGIHQKCYRLNTNTNLAEYIGELPDTLGKIASSASLIGDTIYIIGGYHVYSNGSEKSANRVHRFDVVNNQFIEDGSPIPIPIDDQVQVVWRNQLIYVITGWSENKNIPNVQIYNPKSDQWTVGTSPPNTNDYKSFGASGTILNDTIFYFGGATSSGFFSAQNKLRKGVINPLDPTEIDWSISTPDVFTKAYRTACTIVDKQIHWMGGSNKSYNYDGIAYDGSGGVAPSARDLILSAGDEYSFTYQYYDQLPMDLRGIASINDSTKYLVGGMMDNQQVSNKILKLTWSNSLTPIKEVETESVDIKIYPNPAQDYFEIKHTDESRPKIQKIRIIDAQGHVHFKSQPNSNDNFIFKDYISNGLYWVEITINNKAHLQTISIQH